MSLILARVLLLASMDVLSRGLRRSLQRNAGPAENPRLLQGNSASRHGSFRVALRRARYVIVAAVLAGKFFFLGFTRAHFCLARVPCHTFWVFMGGVFPELFENFLFVVWAVGVATPWRCIF